jgi:hypothetical protein
MMILPNGKGLAKQLSAGIQNGIIGISAQTVKKEAKYLCYQGRIHFFCNRHHSRHLKN